MRRPLLVAAAAALALSVIAMPGAGAAPAHESGGPVFTGETTKSILPAKVHAQAGKPGGGQPISYHRGPVMTSGVTAYYIYYGDWSGGGQPILENFASGVGGTPYWAINTGYYDAASKHVLAGVTRQGGHLGHHRPRQRPLRRQHPDHREQRDHQRSASLRPERRVLPAHRQASPPPAGSSPSTAAGTPTRTIAGSESSTPSSATRAAPGLRAADHGPNGNPGSTRWRRSPTSSRRPRPTRI